MKLTVVGASAGGVESLRGLLAQLPAALPTAVLVVLHQPSSGGTALPTILNRAGPLPAAHAHNGEDLSPARVYVAPPDHHLVVVGGQTKLSKGPRQHGHRPAIDPLFLSAARTAGQNVTAVVLSGTLDDGASGAAAVESRGGHVLVQDPEEAAYAGMPTAAIAATMRPTVLGLADLAAEVTRLAEEPVSASVLEPDPDLERELAILLHSEAPSHRPPGDHRFLSCPDCGGPLYEVDHPATRYECRVGHSWSAQSLLESHNGAVERALWMAVLRLEERHRLTERLADSAEHRGHHYTAKRFREESAEARDAAQTIKRLFEDLPAAQAQWRDRGA